MVPLTLAGTDVRHRTQRHTEPRAPARGPCPFHRLFGGRRLRLQRGAPDFGVGHGPALHPAAGAHPRSGAETLLRGVQAGPRRAAGALRRRGAARARRGLRSAGRARGRRRRIERGGLATIPPAAPSRVAAIINAANSVARKPYVYGGGHGRLADETFVDTAYDCSGSVSFALAAAGLVDSPMDSSRSRASASPAAGAG